MHVENFKLTNKAESSSVLEATSYGVLEGEPCMQIIVQNSVPSANRRKHSE